MPLKPLFEIKTVLLAIALCLACVMRSTAFAAETSPLVIGETFTMHSTALGETRRINVYLPAGYAEHPDQRLPVLYMPDGGIAEDFLHVAGLLQVSIGNGTMRPFLLVGIENTQRRRDMTPPTHVDKDRAIAPVVGGAAAYRRFLREELIPEINQRYRTTGEKAIVGESLAGLFVLDTWRESPELFDTYIAFDPSLWWDGASMTQTNCTWLKAHPALRNRVYVASSSEPSLEPLIRKWSASLARCAPPRMQGLYQPMPDETHATIYHPAALKAFRALFKPTDAATKP